MSLEDKIAKLTEALAENTAALNEVIAGRADVLEAAGSVNERSPKKTAAKAETKKASPKKLTEEDVRKAFGAFLNIDEEKERAARKKFVVEILSEYDGVKKATDLDEADRESAIKKLEDFSFDAGEQDEDLV